jgi:hypothetical protein
VQDDINLLVRLPSNVSCRQDVTIPTDNHATPLRVSVLQIDGDRRKLFRYLRLLTLKSNQVLFCFWLKAASNSFDLRIQRHLGDRSRGIQLC